MNDAMSPNSPLHGDDVAMLLRQRRTTHRSGIGLETRSSVILTEVFG